MTASWLFLAFAVWCAAWTVVSFRSPPRPAWLMFVSFFAAWLTTEGAVLHLLWQMVVVVVFVAFGALDHWPGWLALAITLASWWALAVSVRIAMRSGRVVARDLDDALGGEWVSSRVEWRRVAMPFHFKRRHVHRIRNVQYVDDGNRRHRLDVYRSSDVRENAPVLLQIPGGGWMISNKDQQAQPLLWHLAQRGWVCVAINYRLSPKATWPDHLVDCKLALAWVREHIREYGGDPEYVVVTGGSAGGHLTAMMALTANDPEWQPGFESVDTSVRAMVPFYGVYDWTGGDGNRHSDGLRVILERYIVKQRYSDAHEIFANASPVNHVRPDAPPAMIVHGTLDTLAPVAQARAFASRLRETSANPVAYIELDDAHHAFDVFNSIRTLHTIAGVDAFLEWILSRDPPAARSLADAARIHTEAAAQPVSDRRSTARTAPTPDSPE